LACNESIYARHNTTSDYFHTYTDEIHSSVASFFFQTVSPGENRSMPNRVTLYMFRRFDCALRSYLSKGNFVA